MCPMCEHYVPIVVKAFLISGRCCLNFRDLGACFLRCHLLPASADDT